MTALSITATAIIPVAAPTNNQVNVFEYGPALAAITAGQSVYKDTSTTPPSFGLCDVDHATAANRIPAGVCVGPAVAAGQQVAVQVAGQLAFGAILTKGLIYTATATAGGIGPSADQASGWNINTLGLAISTSILELSVKSTNVTI